MNSEELFINRGLAMIPIEVDDLQFKGDKVKELMRDYSREVAKDFFIWYGVKIVGFIEYIKDIRPIVTSNEMEEKIKEFEGKTFDELFNLYLQSLNQ